MSRNVVVLLSLVFFSFSLGAQARLSKKITDGGHKKKKFGTYSGFGATNMIGSVKNTADSHSFTSTTSYNLNYRPVGGLAPFARFGVFLTPSGGPFGMIEFGLGYKQYKGGQELNALRIDGADISFPQTVYHKALFTHHMADIHFNFQNIIPLSKKHFILHGPGLSFEMMFRRKIDIEGSTLIPIDTEIDKKFLTSSLTYGAGYGVKLSDGRFLMIDVRTSFLSLFNDGNKSALRPIFESQFRPVMLGAIKYSWLSNKADISCVGVKGSSGSGGRFSKRKPNVGRYPW